MKTLGLKTKAFAVFYCTSFHIYTNVKKKIEAILI